MRAGLLVRCFSDGRREMLPSSPKKRQSITSFSIETYMELERDGRLF
jgi:hypothetical protein